MPDRLLTSVHAERLIQQAALRGESAIPLGHWHRLSLTAMSKLLVFGIGRAHQKPTTTPLRLTLGSQAILRELYQMRFFRIAASDANIEAFSNADLFAREESTAVSQDSRQCMAYERVAEPDQTRDDFYAKCGQFLTRLQLLFETTLVFMGYDAQSIRTFYRPSKEIIENIHLHSGSWGFGGARLSGAGLEISYADLGRGIRTSLISNPDYHAWSRQRRHARKTAHTEAEADEPNHATAICDAFEWGVTGRQGESRGTGLFEVRAFALSHQGTVECRSGTARVLFRPDRPPSVYPDLLPIPGVQLTIYLPLVENHG